MKLPNCKTPCKNCPFRKDIEPGWLGGERMQEILNQSTFSCHKTVNYDLEDAEDKGRLQCAGHMILRGEKNTFVALAKKLKLDTGLKGHELIFDNEKDLIQHHDNG